jgi:hypothetical protein
MKFLCLEHPVWRALCMGPAYRWLRAHPRWAVAFPLPARHRQAVRDFCARLDCRAPGSTVASDICTILRLELARGLEVQLARDTKTGTAPAFGFVGSDRFYATLGHGRYRAVPRPPADGPDFVSFVVVDELLHEALHVLFHAQATRGADRRPHSYFAEEASVSWWGAELLAIAYGEWLRREDVLRINHDFFLRGANAVPFCFWDTGHVLERQARVSPWIAGLAAALPARDCYIGERPDAVAFFAGLREEPGAAFVFRQPAGLLRIPQRLPARS